MAKKRKVFESGESSKKGEKRSKKQQEATIAATVNEGRSGSIRISAESSDSPSNDAPSASTPSNTSPNSPSNAAPNTEGESNDSQKPKKKGRGPNKLRQKDKGKAIEVEFNQRSQPIGEGSIKMSTFLGALVRENVKVTLKSWSSLPDAIEQALWACLQQKFCVEECRRKSLVQKMGKHLRDYKSLLTKMIRNLAQCEDGTSQLALAKPDNLTSDEWASFIKQRLSKDFEAKSKNFKEMRKKQDLPHTMSRHGYARLEDDMKREAENPEEVSRMDVWIRGHSKDGGKGKPINDIVAEIVQKMKEVPREPTNNIKNDALAKVIGPERRGWVRGMGFGATPSKVNAEIEKCGTMRQLQNRVIQLEQLVEKLIARPSGSSPIESERSNAENIGNVDNTSNANVSATKLHSVSVGLEGCSREALPQIDAKCKLLHWVGSGQEVAEASIASTDPQSNVHHVPLGPDCWKVWVNHCLVDVPLFRSTKELYTTKEAEGSTTAWPIKYIVMEG